MWGDSESRPDSESEHEMENDTATLRGSVVPARLPPPTTTARAGKRNRTGETPYDHDRHKRQREDQKPIVERVGPALVEARPASHNSSSSQKSGLESSSGANTQSPVVDHSKRLDYTVKGDISGTSDVSVDDGQGVTNGYLAPRLTESGILAAKRDEHMRYLRSALDSDTLDPEMVRDIRKGHKILWPQYVAASTDDAKRVIVRIYR
jgi:hypothetical protein